MGGQERLGAAGGLDGEFQAGEFARDVQDLFAVAGGTGASTVDGATGEAAAGAGVDGQG